MTSNLAHSIRLYPTKSQEVLFKKACGCARISYNYALTEYKKILDSGQKPNILEIKKQFNQDKKILFPWMCETNKDANQQPFSNLQIAFNRFFKKQSNFPKFKKKGKNDSFYISNDRFGTNKNKFRIPKLGWVKGAEELRFEGKILSATVSRKADYWFVSINVETTKAFTTCENQEVVGVDLGIKTLASLSTGQKIESPKPLRKNIKKLKTLHRKVSRKVKGSSNRKKVIVKLAKFYYQLSCLRKDTIDKLTTHLCKNFKTICIEDLNTKGMLKNHKLALSISDMGWGTFKQQLTYKAKLYNNELVLVDRFYPSSKTCSSCGSIKETLSLSDRTYVCESCNLVIDRDLNAAINLRNYGLINRNG